MTQIIEKSDWNYVLSTDGTNYYILVPVAESATSIHYLIQLTEDEINQYKELSSKFLDSFAADIRYYTKYSERNIFNHSSSSGIIEQLKSAGGFYNMTI